MICRLGLVLLLATGCGGRDDPGGPAERTIGTMSVGRTQLQVVAHFSGHSRTTGELIRGADSFFATFELRSAEAGVELFALERIVGGPDLGSDGVNARERFGRLSLDTCRRGEDVIFRVTGAPRRGPPSWTIVHPLDDDAVVHGGFLSIQSECGAAAAQGPATEAHVVQVAAHSSNACEALERLGDRPRAIACVLRHGGPEDYAARLEAQIAGDAASDLFAALRPSSPDQVVGTPTATRFLRVLSLEERRRFVLETIERCRAADIVCAPQLVQLVGDTARELDAEACDAVTDLAGVYLAREGHVPAATALGALRSTLECQSDERHVALLRAGLGRFSTPPETRNREWACTNPNVGDTELALLATCPSLPRFAGAWLARRCRAQGADPESVARARSLLTPDRLAQLWAVADPITDGAIRVLASCAPEEWHALFDAHPRAVNLRPYHRPAPSEPPAPGSQGP